MKMVLSTYHLCWLYVKGDESILNEWVFSLKFFSIDIQRKICSGITKIYKLIKGKCGIRRRTDFFHKEGFTESIWVSGNR